jgi:PKD repeat protein
MDAKKWLGTSLVLLSLIGCGGGGGDSDSGGTISPPANVVPTASAGADQAVNENALVTLTGSGSDSDGSIASYSWSQTSGTIVTLTNSNSASATFTTPDISADQTLSFKLTVTDDDGASANSTTRVTIQPVDFFGTVITDQASEINLTNAKISGSWSISGIDMVECVIPYWSSDITIENVLNNSPLGLCNPVNEREKVLSGLTCGTTYKYLFAIREEGATSWTNAIKGEVKEFTTIACDTAPNFPQSFESVYILLSNGSDLEALISGANAIIVESGQYLIAQVNPDEFSSDTELKFEISQDNSSDIIYTNSETITISEFKSLFDGVIPDTLICDTEYRVRAVTSTQWNEVFSDYYNIKMAPCNTKTQDFKVTTGSYDETQDNNQACISEFGDSYQIADWNDVVNYHSTYSSMDDFFTAVSMLSPGQEGARSLQVSKDRSELYSSSRHYFITRHDHSKPGYYLSHANIDDHLIDLGSWNGARPVLCLNNSTSTQEIETVEDAYGSITELTSIENTGAGKVQTTLELVNDEKVDATVNIVANNIPLTLDFSIENKNIVNTRNQDEVRITLVEKVGGYEITIPKSLMASWAESDVIVSSNGKEIPAEALTVINDDPVMFWNSSLIPVVDYVKPINIDTDKTNNKAIDTSVEFWNEYSRSYFMLNYQVLYFANYSAINSDTRDINVIAQMAEEDIIGDDYLKNPYGERRYEMDITLKGAREHTSGVFYHIGPDGWFAQDAKTLDIFYREGEENIGTFSFKYDRRVFLDYSIAQGAEFFAHIKVTDGNLKEEYDGDHFKSNKKVPYKKPELKIIAPAEGEQLLSGSIYEIKWESYYWGRSVNTTFSYGTNKDDLDNFTTFHNGGVGGGESKEIDSLEWIVPSQLEDAFYVLMEFDGAGDWGTVVDSGRLSKQFSIVGTAGPGCDVENLNLCSTENTCLSAGGYWYGTACHREPKEVSPPVASFTTDCNNLTCTFNASSSYDPDGNVASYAWNFGDGSTSSRVNVEHSYDNAGSFTVTLTVIDDNGLTDTTNNLVTVNESIQLIPQNVIAVAGNEKITISWDAVSGAAQYAVYMSETSGNFSGYADVTLDGELSTTYTLEGLVNGSTYYLVVLSITNGNVSEFSNEVSVVPDTPASSEFIYYEADSDNDSIEKAQSLGRVNLSSQSHFKIIGHADDINIVSGEVIGGEDYYTFIASKTGNVGLGDFSFNGVLNIMNQNGDILHSHLSDEHGSFNLSEGNTYTIYLNNYKNEGWDLGIVAGAEYTLFFYYNN